MLYEVITREDTVIVGDRMDTDIISGIESEIETVLVLSGVTDEKEMRRFAYRPGYILNGVGDIPGATRPSNAKEKSMEKDGTAE